MLYLKKKKNLSINRIYLFELETYRYLEHCGPNNDDSLNYRPKKEIEFWKSSDFNKKLYLDKYVRKFFSRKSIDNIKKNVLKEIDQAFVEAQKGKSLSINQLTEIIK